MYAIKSDGTFLGYTDALVYVKLSAAGSYVPTDPVEADGVCVKIPTEIQDETDGTTRLAMIDAVFSLPGHQLERTERSVEIEPVSASLLLNSLARETDSMEQLRADVDYLAVMSGIDL